MLAATVYIQDDYIYKKNMEELKEAVHITGECENVKVYYTEYGIVLVEEFEEAF